MQNEVVDILIIGAGASSAAAVYSLSYLIIQVITRIGKFFVIISIIKALTLEKWRPTILSTKMTLMFKLQILMELEEGLYSILDIFQE